MRRTRGFRRSSRGSSRPIRAREWSSFSTSPTDTFGEPGPIVISPGTTFYDWAADPNDLRDFYDEPTLVRTLIYDSLHVLISASTNPAINCSLYVGLISYKNDNFPVTEGPFTDDATKDWVYWQHWMMFNGGANSGFVEAGTTVNPGDKIDLKTKRKFQSGEGLLACAWAPVNNTHDVVWAMNGRYLLLNG